MMPADKQSNTSERIILKKEVSAAFLRIGLLTVLIGAASILIGLWLKTQFHGQPLVAALPLLLGIPIVVTINHHPQDLS